MKMEKEHFDFLYPLSLPENLRITDVYLQHINEIETTIALAFNNINVSLTISNVYKVSDDTLKELEKYEGAPIPFYIKKISESSFQAIGRKGSYEYYILCDNYDNLIYIINNMKGN